MLFQEGCLFFPLNFYQMHIMLLRILKRILTNTDFMFSLPVQSRILRYFRVYCLVLILNISNGSLTFFLSNNHIFRTNHSRPVFTWIFTLELLNLETVSSVFLFLKQPNIFIDWFCCIFFPFEFTMIKSSQP